MTAEPMRQRIALFLNDMHSAGGIQRVAANLARDLSPQYDTRVLTVYRCPNPVFHEQGMTFDSIDMPFVPGAFYPGRREALYLGWLLRRYVREQRIDIVICFWVHLAIIGAFALPKSVIRIGYEHIAFSAGIGRWRILRQLAYPRLDAVVSLSQDDQASFAAISKRARVIPNYVDIPASPTMEQREKIILVVGHIEHRKGLDRLLWSLQEPLLANPDWRLVFVGGGEQGRHEDWYLRYLHAQIILLRLGDLVEFHPATNHIDTWYRRASIYVMGSRLEGFPMVLLEAKAHGLPIIAFNCPTGPKEIVRHGIDGFLIEHDTQEYARAAQALMTDTGLRKRMSTAAVTDARQRFSRDQICGRWHDLFAEATAAKHPANGISESNKGTSA